MEDQVEDKMTQGPVFSAIPSPKPLFSLLFIHLLSLFSFQSSCSHLQLSLSFSFLPHLSPSLLSSI